MYNVWLGADPYQFRSDLPEGLINPGRGLGWLKTVSNTFQDLDFDVSL